MRIVVFGSSGRVGSTLVPFLLSRGYSVAHTFINKKTNTRADLTSKQEMYEILDTENPDIVINLAALTDVDECERKPVAAYLLNVKVVENLTKWILQKKPGCYVLQLSTDQLYDGPGPHREEDHVLSNYYGYSKYVSELTAATVSCTILRTNFIGRSNCETKQSLTDWIINSLRAGDNITVFEDVLFSPLSLDKLSAFIEIVIQKRIAGVYNLGSKEGMSKAELAYTLADILGLSTVSMKRGSSDSLNLVRYRPKDMRMDSTLFETTFGVELPTMREEILLLKPLYEK